MLLRRLLAQLDMREQRAILVHELAHLRRRDHWTNWFQLGLLAIYWWNPVAWWAHSRARRAVEECCDAWVVWALPT